MGPCASKNVSSPNKLSISKFKIGQAIGRGGFGKVYIVEKNGQ